MDRVFKKRDIVQALDTEYGVWRNANVSFITANIVELDFYEFPAKARFRTEKIDESVVHEQAKWPIRHPVPALPLQGKRNLKNNPDDKPATRVLRDVVHVMGGGDGEVLERYVLLNDPFQEIMIVTISDRMPVENLPPWYTYIATIGQIIPYKDLVQKPKVCVKSYVLFDLQI